jgi:hypothetical protein
MSERRILVIGSQCEALKNSHLPFLPQVAQDLYAVMTDPERGACVSAIEGDGLLLNPTVKDTKEAIKSAYRRASKDEASLFISYIGHGERLGEDFYLLPHDAAYPPADSDTAVHLINVIKETHRSAEGGLDGLAVLVDACYSGNAGFGAAQAWTRALEGTLRFELLTAAADRPAADGCFSRNIVRLLREGISATPSEHLLCIHLRPLIKISCPNQEPQHPSYNPDETLWLARNAGRTLEPWAHTAAADEVQRLTLGYQLTPALSEVVEQSREQRCLVVLGEAGAGKSALSAALAWPKVAGAIVPGGFVQAVALLTEATTPQELARAVGAQLARAVEGFKEVQQALAHEMPQSEWQKLGVLERQVVEPLKRLKSPTTVRLVIDGLDRVATGALGSVMAAIEELAELDFMRLVITARLDTVLPKAVSAYSLPRAADENVIQYLERRGIPENRRVEVANSSEGNWLVARVLSDLLCERPDAEIRAAGQLALGDAYEELLLRSGAANENGTQQILETLAAAGAGPLLPLSMLCVASKTLGGPSTPVNVRDQLVRLRGLAVRSAAGTDQEHVGLFHDTLVQHIAARAPNQNRAAHRAIVAGIEALAPVAGRRADLSGSEQRYAFEREAEHLWALGETQLALHSLLARVSPVPRDNLQRWRPWLPRLEDLFGPDHRNTLAIRHNVAQWTGEFGDDRGALRLFRALLPDQERTQGPDHPETLAARSNIANYTGRCGDFRVALRLFRALLPDQERVLGPDHPHTLTTRHNIAHWTAHSGDVVGALQLFRALLPDRERTQGPDHRETLAIRGNIANCVGECGDGGEALRLYQALLPDQERTQGPDHPDALAIRNNIAGWTGRCGDSLKALQLYQALLPDQERVLGLDHPASLRTRSNIAGWIGECGDGWEALRLYQALLPDQERVLGLDHPDSLGTRSNIAGWTDECGDGREALRLNKALLPDHERVLGPDHPHTLTICNRIARLTDQCGDALQALRLYQKGLPDQARVFGPDHPDTLTIRSHIAGLTYQCGDAREALRLYKALLPDQKRVLGPDHPDTLAIRNNIAALTYQLGGAREALRRYKALLPDQERVLGPDHPQTLTTREWINQWGQA